MTARSPILTPDEVAAPKQRVSAKLLHEVAAVAVMPALKFVLDLSDLRAAYAKLAASHEALRAERDAATARADAAEAALAAERSARVEAETALAQARAALKPFAIAGASYTVQVAPADYIFKLSAKGGTRMTGLRSSALRAAARCLAPPDTPAPATAPDQEVADGR